MSVTIQSLGGFDPANPGAIGGTTPAAGTFTTVNGTVDLQVAGTSIFARANTWTTATTTYSYSDDAAGPSPLILLDRISASPAAGDFMGALRFNGRNTSAATILYGQIHASIANPAPGSEASLIQFYTQYAGAGTTRMYVGGGLYMAGSTDPGPGVIAADGLKFPATAVASANANTLDDYEEGTFTPSIGGDATAGSQTYGAWRFGIYTKIGNRVAYTITLNITAKDAATSGSIVVTGLPFAATSLIGVPVARFSLFDLSVGFTYLGADIISNTIIRLQQCGDNVGSIALPAAGLLAGAHISLNGIYDT